ncbi:MAG: hypothetical protein Q9169_000408 [Polycauliona sp. 2 TL-2023]
MSPPSGIATPGLATFLGSLKTSPIESSVEQLVSLLRRRQIRGSRSCAIATAHLLRTLLRNLRVTDVTKLIERVQQVGQKLAAAQPTELAVGNIIRRILGLIRDEAEEDRDGEAGGYGDMETGSRDVTSTTRPDGQTEPSEKRPLPAPSTSTNPPAITSLFSLVPAKGPSPLSTPGTRTPGGDSVPLQESSTPNTAQDLRAEVVEGVQEIIDELNQADDQIASYAVDHIHSSEFVLTYTPSMTVQRFLLKAAAKRKFTVIYAEPFSNHQPSRSLAANPKSGSDDDERSSERFLKSLTAAGVTVVVVPFSAVFALMSRASKVVLDSHAVLADGSLVATAGARAIAQAASMHHTPVIVLGGVYKLSPVYPSDIEALLEYGDPSSVIGYDQGTFLEKIDVRNPLFDHVPANLVALYITNLYVE